MKKLFLTLMVALAFTATTFAQLVPEGEYVIRFAQSPDYVLTLKDGKASNTNPVQLGRWINDKSQRWKITHNNGKIVIRSMVDNNYVLDIKGYNYSNNAEVYIYGYHGQDNQLWIPERMSNGSYILKIAGDPNYCLDLKSGIAKEGNMIELWKVHKGFQEQWILDNAPKPVQSSNASITVGGVYVIKFAKNPEYVLTLKDGKACNANPVQLWKWRNDNSQKWKITEKDGNMVIRSMVDNNYVLDIKGYNYSDNAEVYIYSYHGQANQVWIPERMSNGSFVFKIAGNPDYCLDLKNGTAQNGNAIELWKAHKGYQQQWLLEKAH